MLTPAGRECRFYYQDYHRGHSEEDCRLIRGNPRSPAWEQKDCSNCSVPDVLLANSSPDLVLEATVKTGILGLGRKVEVVTERALNPHLRERVLAEAVEL